MDPSIRTPDPVFEALLLIGGIGLIVAIIGVCVVAYMINKDRRG